MDAAAGLSRPPEMTLLRTLRSGRTLYTEVVLALPDAPSSPSTADASPAALGDAATAAFLSRQVGAANTWSFVGSAGTVTLAGLGLSPADALALSLDDLLDLARLALADTGPIGGTGPALYARAVRLAGLIGRRPATPGDVSDKPDAADDPTAVAGDLAARHGRLRTAANALVGRLRDADPAISAQALTLARRWGIVTESTADAADQLTRRLAAAPTADVAAGLRPAAIADAMAALFSPTLQLAVTSRLSTDTLAQMSGAPGIEEWLSIVAAVRERLAVLEMSQLAAGTPAGNGPPFPALATKPADLWQRDSDDTRRLIVAYAADGVDLVPGRTVAVAVLDRFTEVVPGSEQTTGAAFGFDAPGSRAAQAILLAVPPDLDAGLRPEILVQIVAETRDLARARMARPADLPPEFGTWLPTGLLPATGSTATPLGRVRFGGGFE